MSKIFKFNSGLTLLYSKNKINKSTSLDITFGCGARCDGNLPGLSHFCEHMFFTGTDKLNKQEVTKRYYDFIKVNACTNIKTITFFGSIFTNKLAEYFSTVIDMICNSTFSKEAVEEEKKVVIQEIVRDKDQTKKHSTNMFKYQLYNIEAYRDGILGDEESVSKITSKDVRKYVKKYFVKNNCTIYISTPLSFSKTKSIVKKYFDKCLPESNIKALPYNIEKLNIDETVSLIDNSIDKNYVRMAFIFNKGHNDFRYKYVLNTISNMMDDFGEGIIKPLRLEQNLVYNIDVGYATFDKQSALIISTETSTENIKKCIDGIADYLNNLLEKGFTKEELDKRLEADNYFWQSRIESPEDNVEDLYRHTVYGKFFEDKLIHKIKQSVTLDEVNNTLREIFNDYTIQCQVYGDAGKKDIYSLKQIKNKFNNYTK